MGDLIERANASKHSSMGLASQSEDLSINDVRNGLGVEVDKLKELETRLDLQMSSVQVIAESYGKFDRKCLDICSLGFNIVMKQFEVSV